VVTVVVAVPPDGDSRQDELAAARQATSRRNLPHMTINDSKYSGARSPWGKPTTGPELTPRNRPARWSRGDGLGLVGGTIGRVKSVRFPARV
jgi:hypothetical protein